MGSDADWLTWPQAAELVGCGVSTIDWHTRTGRIAHRPRQGRRPSLERASVVEFADWWAARQAERARRRAERETRGRVSRAAARRGPHPPALYGWLSVGEAADDLGVSSSSVIRFAATGELEGQLHDGCWWITESSVAELAAERGRWITYVEAGRLAGCSTSVVGRAVRRGEIVSRPQAGTVLPSLDRESVQAWAQTWAQRRAQVLAEQERHRAVRVQARRSVPPADGEVWLDAVTAALVLGFTPEWVRAMARREQLPAVRRGARWWFRRRDVEQVAAARALRARWGRP